MLRPLVATDFEAWSEVRLRNGEWLTKWEPMPLITSPDPAISRDAFTHRCAARDRERQAGNAYCLGLFVNNVFAGEVNLNSVVRGAMQSGTIGYWIDEAKAGNSYMSEAVLVLAKFAFDELRLHRVEVCIIPRNASSHRVVEKLALRNEGTSERFLEINGIWEDHVRYGFTIEEWQTRREELSATWL
jgi:ribosomal-protein-alanine N-acetyltransferase